MALLISYPDWMQATGVTITPDSETPDMPGASVAVTASDEFWRTLLSDSVDAAGISIDLGQGRPIDLFAFQWFRQNLSTDIDEVNYRPDRIRIRASNVAVGDAEALDTGWINCNSLAGYATWFRWLGSTITARWVRIDFDCASLVPDLKFDVYRIYIGPKFSPAINMDWGCNETWVDGNSTMSQGSRSTTRYFGENEKYRNWSFNLSWIKDETERGWWKDFERRVSKTREIAITDTLEATGRGDMFAFQSALNGISATRTGISGKTIRLDENI